MRIFLLMLNLGLTFHKLKVELFPEGVKIRRLLLVVQYS
jgi:hypothetical protein